MSNTVDEYLALEREAATKHEYENGVIIAMTGASRAHNLIVANMVTLLNTQLRDRPCEVYAADMRLRVDTAYRYPDLSVVCGEPQLDETEQPPSIELRDRVQKLAQYRLLSSLQDYLLVAQDRARVER